MADEALSGERVDDGLFVWQLPDRVRTNGVVTETPQLLIVDSHGNRSCERNVPSE